MLCHQNDQIHHHLSPASSLTVSEALNANSNDRNSQQLVAGPTAGTVGDERAKSALLLRLEVDLATVLKCTQQNTKRVIFLLSCSCFSQHKLNLNGCTKTETAIALLIYMKIMCIRWALCRLAFRSLATVASSDNRPSSASPPRGQATLGHRPSTNVWYYRPDPPP